MIAWLLRRNVWMLSLLGGVLWMASDLILFGKPPRDATAFDVVLAAYVAAAAVVRSLRR